MTTLIFRQLSMEYYNVGRILLRIIIHTSNCCTSSLFLSSFFLSFTRSPLSTRMASTHTCVRDVVPRPTRPHGHCQLGVTRIICVIILDNRRHRLVVNEENLHTMPLVTARVSPFRGDKRVPRRTSRGERRGGGGGSRKATNYRKERHWRRD